MRLTLPSVGHLLNHPPAGVSNHLAHSLLGFICSSCPPHQPTLQAGKSLRLRGWNMWGACRKITQAISPLLSQQDSRGQAGQQRPSSLGLVFDGSPGGRSTGWVLDKGLEGAEMEAAVPVRLWVWGKYRSGWSGLDETKRRWEQDKDKSSSVLCDTRQTFGPFGSWFHFHLLRVIALVHYAK